jgi:hypothetical protein
MRDVRAQAEHTNCFLFDDVCAAVADDLTLCSLVQGEHNLLVPFLALIILAVPGLGKLFVGQTPS